MTKVTVTKAIVADNKPKCVRLEKGKQYHYCTCGRSAKQPFCDGSHQGTTFKPLSFIAEFEMLYFCLCKQTSIAPFCDGAHLKLKSSLNQ